MLQEFCFSPAENVFIEFNLNDHLTTTVQHVSCSFRPLWTLDLYVSRHSFHRFLWVYIRQRWIERVFLWEFYWFNASALFPAMPYEVFRMILIYSSVSALYFRSLWQIALADLSRRVIKEMAQFLPGFLILYLYGYSLYFYEAYCILYVFFRTFLNSDETLNYFLD